MRYYQSKSLGELFDVKFASASPVLHRPIWGDSVPKESVRFESVSNKARQELWFAAIEYNQRTKGGLGGNGLMVLQALLFGFLNTITGQCDPSQETIAKYTGLCRDTVARALVRLRDCGFIAWVKRSEKQANGLLKQISNAYQICRSRLRPKCPAPSPEILGAGYTIPHTIEEQIKNMGLVTLEDKIKVMERHMDDPLMASLARMGRMFEDREKVPQNG